MSIEKPNTPHVLSVIKKFDRGDSLSNNELDRLMTYYDGVVASLAACPPEYFLVKKDCIRKSQIISDYISARKESGEFLLI